MADAAQDSDRLVTRSLPLENDVALVSSNARGMEPRFGSLERDAVFCIFDISAVELHHAHEERLERRQIDLRQLRRHLLEVKPRRMTDEVSHRVERIVSAELSRSPIEPVVELFGRDVGGFDEKLIEKHRRRHPQDELLQIFGIGHHIAERSRDFRQLRCELFPIARLDSLRISHRHHFNLLRLQPASSDRSD